MRVNQVDKMDSVVVVSYHKTRSVGAISPISARTAMYSNMKRSSGRTDLKKGYTCEAVISQVVLFE